MVRTDDGPSRKTANASTSISHNAPANSRACPSSRQVERSRNRVDSHARSPGSPGVRCEWGAGSASTSPSRNRSTAATCRPARAVPVNNVRQF